MPITSLVANWSVLEEYLLKDLRMEPKVVEALATSELNLLEVSGSLGVYGTLLGSQPCL